MRAPNPLVRLRTVVYRGDCPAPPSLTGRSLVSMGGVIAGRLGSRGFVRNSPLPGNPLSVSRDWERSYDVSIFYYLACVCLDRDQPTQA